MNYYLTVLKKYAKFNGRSRRAEYWYFTLFNAIICIILSIIDVLVISNSGTKITFGILSSIYSLAVLIPSIAVSIRRLHDIGKSGWMIFISLIPLIGSIWLLVLMVTNGNPGENKYGSDPKRVTTI